MIIAPDGSDVWVPAKPRPDETIIRALAETEGITRSFATDNFD